jgi:hypothetical protein
VRYDGLVRGVLVPRYAADKIDVQWAWPAAILTDIDSIEALFGWAMGLRRVCRFFFLFFPIVQDLGGPVKQTGPAPWFTLLLEPGGNGRVMVADTVTRPASFFSSLTPFAQIMRQTDFADVILDLLRSAGVDIALAHDSPLYGLCTRPDEIFEGDGEKDARPLRRIFSLTMPDRNVELLGGLMLGQMPAAGYTLDPHHPLMSSMRFASRFDDLAAIGHALAEFNANERVLITPIWNTLRGIIFEPPENGAVAMPRIGWPDGSFVADLRWTSVLTVAESEQLGQLAHLPLPAKHALYVSSLRHVGEPTQPWLVEYDTMVFMKLLHALYRVFDLAIVLPPRLVPDAEDDGPLKVLH